VELDKEELELEELDSLLDWELLDKLELHEENSIEITDKRTIPIIFFFIK